MSIQTGGYTLNSQLTIIGAIIQYLKEGNV